MRTLLLSMALGGCVIHVNTTSDQVLIDQPFTAVVADLGSGSLQVSAADIEGAQIYRDLAWTGRDPDLRAEVQGETLYIEAVCHREIFCSLDHEVILPAGVWVELHTGSGDVDVQGVEGGGVIETGSGELTLALARGNFVLETGSGDIDLTSLVGDLQISTGSGEIVGDQIQTERLWGSTGSGDISLDLSGSRLGVDLSTGSGDVMLWVPAGSYALGLSTGSGDISTREVSNSSGSASTIDISTGSGEITIHGR